MQLHLAAFPPEVPYPNALLNESRPAGIYQEERSPEDRPGRQFRLTNAEEIRADAKRTKWFAIRQQVVFTIGGLIVGVILFLLCAFSGAEALAAGIGGIMIIGAGMFVLKVAGAIVTRPKIYHFLVLQGNRLYFLDEQEQQAHDFGLQQVGELEKRSLNGRHFLLFKLKTDPKRLVPESPAFVWEPETEALFSAALKSAHGKVV